MGPTRKGFTVEHAHQLLDDYADWMRSWGASHNTVEARTSVLRPRLALWGGLPGITRPNIEAWLGSIPADRPWTRATYHSHAKSLCDWLVASGRLAANPMDGIKAPRRPRGVPKPLRETEAERALEAAEGDVRAWLILALYAGLRAHEIAKLRGEDVSEELLYVRGKGGVEAEIPTHPKVWALAQSYPSRGYWFPDPARPAGHVDRNRISTRVAALFRRCGISHGSIHRARHLYATRLLRKGVNIRVVQKLMRHSDVTTTAGYTAVDEDELRAAIYRLPA